MDVAPPTAPRAALQLKAVSWLRGDRAAAAAALCAVLLCAGLAACPGRAAAHGTAEEHAQESGVARPIPGRTPVPTPTPYPEPPLPFGRVIYRASKAASFETLGVAVIACRHKDPVARRFAVQFFDSFDYGSLVSTFGRYIVEEVPTGKKVVFVGDATYFPDRDVINVRVGHFSEGTARVISDAEHVRCMGKMRFDPGGRSTAYWRGMGLRRDGEPPPAKDPW